MFLKRYVTALFKRQWGANLIKYQGVSLPGGITLDGRQLFEDAQNEIREIECIQRDFTSRLHGLKDYDYWDRLKMLYIFSLERRRERYIVLYVFKIIFGVVPNPGISWIVSPRRGRMIQMPSLDHRHTYGQTIKYNSFFCVSARLFNCLPKDIRNLNCKMEQIKVNLDNLLHKIPDEPRLSGYTQYSRSGTNSIQDQIVFIQ